MSSFTHDAFVYGSPGKFVGSLAPFIREGLELGEHVIVVTKPENQGALEDALGDRSEFQTADSTEWYSTPVQTIDRYRRVLQDALGSGRPRLRVVGEVEFGTTEIEHAEWRRYESVLNVAFADQPAWVVCPYDSQKLPGHVVADAARTHPLAISDNQHSESHEFLDPADMVGPLPLAIEGKFLGEFEVGDSLSAVREFVTRTSNQAGLSRPRAEDMCLIVNEIATNGLRHGLPPVRVQAWLGDRDLVYEVSDSGQGPDNPFAGFIPPKVSQGEGMGLWLSRLLADRLEIVSGTGGTSVRASTSTLAV